MQPNISKITLENNPELIKDLLSDLVINPRLQLIKWSKITHQTPNIKIGYPGQHLSSLISGVEGDRSGARGHDLKDGTEVKSCSRIDQLDKCLNCGFPVARLETECANCGSSKIKRNNDSKWLFSVRNPEEVTQLTNRIDRIMLLIGDYPNFEDGDFETLRYQAFEIWPKHARGARFSEIIRNYYERIYMEHKRRSADANPAPKNFWPYQYQFYMCNPIKTFSCTITESTTRPVINIESYVDPRIDRKDIASEVMPTKILKSTELKQILDHASDKEISDNLIPGATIKDFRFLSTNKKIKMLSGIDENLRKYLSLRDTDKISTAKTPYTRRAIT